MVSQVCTHCRFTSYLCLFSILLCFLIAIYFRSCCFFLKFTSSNLFHNSSPLYHLTHMDFFKILLLYFSEFCKFYFILSNNIYFFPVIWFFFHLFQEWNWILKEFFNGCLKCFLSVWYSLSSWSMLIVYSAPRVAGPWRSFKWVLRTVHDIKKLLKFCCNFSGWICIPSHLPTSLHYSPYGPS